MRKFTFVVPTSLIIASAVGACSVGSREEAVGKVTAKTIYGADDRQEPHAYSDGSWAARAEEFTAALIATTSIDASNPDDIRIDGQTLAEKGICADERFAEQPTHASCSATLIADDLVLTAAHCLNDCRSSRFVFDYVVEPSGELRTITSDDVYFCVGNVVYDSVLDYQILRLDRPVVGRAPAAVRVSDEPLAVGTPLVVHGYPTGLPLKLADDAEVLGNAANLGAFYANTDTFRGNSGSGVFDQNTQELVGILVDGPADYYEDGECARPTRCPQDGCTDGTERTEEVTYAFHATQAMCELTVEEICSCGDGACGPLESPASCAADCSCGDGVCSNGESTSTCPADCRVEVLYDYHTEQPNWLTPAIQIRNTGPEPLNLWGTTVRYYFTQEPAGTLTADCWGCSSPVTVTFHQMPGGGCAGATHYADITFPDVIWLDPGSTSDAYRVAFRASSWRAFNPANDYSYQSAAWDYAPNPKIVLYDRLGHRRFGVEPCPGVFVPG